ncbi:uncharacterized protein LOC131977794 isoform X2 [Centropristis striata]|uniref:uncharacterized protein LOC131977794 isoform X2 n=1 Tax=Centropristis striata TaxID=184440 RepID=UPI0027E028F4|nr:uncharacterized protein LOC131977794 isoform X2 [Centropristis striata]
MKFIHVAVAVLSLLSVGQSAPVSSCESLIQPREINGTEQLLGTWTHIAEATNVPLSKFLTDLLLESSRVKVTAANESDTMNLFLSQKSLGRCFSFTYKATLEQNTLTSAHPLPLSAALLSTGCSDCNVFYTNFTIGGRTFNSVQLTSRRDKVAAAELEEFTKQVECLNLPAPAIMDPEKGFCSDEVTDLTQFLTDMGSDVQRLLDGIINSLGRIQTLGEAGSKSQDDV